MRKRKIICKVVSISAVILLLPFVSFAGQNPMLESPAVSRALKRMQQQLIRNARVKSKPAVGRRRAAGKKIRVQHKRNGISGITLKNNEVDIKLLPDTHYRVHFYKGINTLAVDILKPSHVFFGRYYRVKGSGVIKAVVAARHSVKTDECPYGFPYARVSVILNRAVQYKAVMHNGVLIIKFKPTEFRTVQNPGTVHSGKFPSEVAKTYDISLKNISCIISPYPIKQVLYSRESGIQIQVIGRNVFIKPLPKKILKPDGTYAYIYSKSPKDIYVVTPVKVYSLNLVPKKNIPSVTYLLSPAAPVLPATAKRKSPFMEKEESFFGGSKKAGKVDASSYVSLLLSLIKGVYNHRLPDGYILKPYAKEYRYVQLTLKGKYFVTNGIYTVYVFSLKALTDLNLDDSQFIYLFSRPLAIAVVKPKLQKGEVTTLLAVTAKGGNL